MSTPSRHPYHQHSSECCSSSAVASARSANFTTAEAGQEQSTFKIQQMDCPTEEGLLRKVLEPRVEVHSLEFDLMQRKLNVVHTQGFRPQLQKIIAQVGMHGELETATQDNALSEQKTHRAYLAWLRVGLAVTVALGAEAASWLGAPAGLLVVLSLTAIALCGLDVYKKGWISIRYRDLNINALMSIAVTGALILGEWPEAAMVMSLFALAELIEARSLDRARSAVDSLLSLTPDLIDVQLADQTWSKMEASAVPVGALVKVLPGQRLGLDGIVESGESHVNQAPITGESVPVLKSSGEQVYAGSINGMGELQYRITTDYDHSLLARITHSVQQAQKNKAPTQRFVDKFSRVYTPVVVLFAAALAVFPPLFGYGSFTEWVYKALVLLVIACPCALVISTPVAVVSALTAGARQGLLVKGGVYLERARQIRHLILDKTGTLTEGRPRLQDMFVNGVGSDSFKQLAYSLALRSDHPASQTLVIAELHDEPLDVADFQAVPGKGVQGVINAKQYRLGNRAWALEGVPLHDQLLEDWELTWQLKGASFVYLSDGESRVAGFAISDTLRKGVKHALSRLQAQGVTSSIASGDNKHAVAAVAAAVGIEEFDAELLPEQKLELLSYYQKVDLQPWWAMVLTMPPH